MNWKIKSAIFVVLLLLSVCELKAQVYKYQTYCFSYKTKSDYGVWSNWSEWEDSDMLVVINLDKERFTIYSTEIQEYDIYEYEGDEDDRYGGETASFKCVDSHGLRCGVRLRTQADGQLQLYIDYNDMRWVYGIVRR